MATAGWPKIDFIDETLDNGLRVIMSEDHLAPIVAVNLWYNVGSRNERPGKTGLAHLFEHMMFEGSAHVGKSEHVELIRRAGGTFNGSTTHHRTNYFETAPSNQLELMLWLEADRMGGLLDAVNQETLDNQRDVVKNERRQRYDNAPYGLAGTKLRQALVPEGHPYHHDVIGSMEDLSSTTLEDVREFFKTYYAPNNAVISIVGDFDPEVARKWVHRYFSKIPSRDDIPSAPDCSLPLRIEGEPREETEDRVPLARVYLGFRSFPHATREHDAMALASTVLSTGRASRISKRLVRELQLAQDAGFSVSGLPGVSMAIAWATVRPEVEVDRLEEALKEVLASVTEEVPDDDEMERARAQVERGRIGGMMSVRARANALSQAALTYGDPDRANQRLPELLSITPEEVRDAAAAVLRDDNRAALRYLPAKRLQP